MVRLHQLIVCMHLSAATATKVKSRKRYFTQQQYARAHAGRVGQLGRERRRGRLAAARLQLGTRWIVGAVDRGNRRRVTLQLLPKEQARTAPTLFEFARKHIHPNTLLMSDKWAAYNTAHFRNHFWKQASVNHSKREFVRVQAFSPSSFVQDTRHAMPRPLGPALPQLVKVHSNIIEGVRRQHMHTYTTTT